MIDRCVFAACFLLALAARPFVVREAAAADVLLVTAGSTLTTQETQRKNRFELWGHTVTTIEDGDSQANFDTAMAAVDVVYVSEEVSATSVGYKLRLATVGVVSEERALDDELGFSTANGVDWNGTTVTVTDNTHPITSSFSTGSLTIVSSTQTLCYTSGAEASGAQALISYGGAHDLAVLEVGATLANTYSSNNTAAGRRVRLPWGGDSFQASSLNTNGLLIAQNAIDWASSGGASSGPSGITVLLVIDGSSPDSDEKARIDQFEAWGHTVTTIQDSDTQANFDSAAAAADVAYVPETITASSLSYKLREASIGVVSEDRASDYEFGFSDSDPFTSVVAGSIDVVTATHAITAGFSVGSLTLLSTSDDLHYLSGNLAPGAVLLGEISSNPTMLAVDIGGQLATPYNSSDTAAGRRVRLPIANAGFDWSYLNTDGLQLIQNAVLWAASDGLVGHWKLDETTGTLAADQSFYANDGAYVGSPANASDSIRGNARQFAASSEYVEVPSSDVLATLGKDNGDFSVLMWVKPSAAAGAYRPLLLRGTSNTERSPSIFLYNSSNRIHARLSTTASYNSGGDSVGSLPEGRWSQVAVVKSGYSWSLYINGELDVTHTLGAASIGNEGGVGIGSASYNALAASSGIDDVMVYNRAVSLAEVKEHYGLVARYRLDETTGTAAADSSGLGNDATHVDGPTTGDPAVRSNGVAYNGADTNDRTDLPHGLIDGKSTVSVAWWMKTSNTGQTAIISGANSGDANEFLMFFNNATTMRSYIGNSVVGYTIDSVANDQWTHFVYQHDRLTGVEKLHRNGQLVGSATRTSTTDPFEIDAGGLMLGQEQDSVGGGFSSAQALYGSLDDVRIYDRMLDDAEVAEIYGLVGHWKLDETSGAAAADSSGYGVDLTASTAPAWETGAIRSGAADMSAASKLESASGAYSSIDEAFSIACWFQLDQDVVNITSNSWLLDTAGGAGGFDFLIGQSSDVLRVRMYAGGLQTGTETLDFSAITSNKWHNAVVVYDGAEFRMYLDGELKLTNADADGFAAPTEPLSLGQSFPGTIDDVVLYNRAMTAHEIAEHYGLIGHWKLDESSGVTLADDTVFGNDATFASGTPAWVTGKDGGALYFGGSSDADTDASFNPPAVGSVAFWFKPDNDLTTDQRLLGISDTWEVRTDSFGYLVADLGTNGVYNFETDDYSGAGGEWHHIVANYDSENNLYELYGDGVLLVSGSLTLADPSSGVLAFGTRTGSTQRFTGTLDDIRVYNRMVTPDEALDLFNGATDSGLRIMRWVEVR